ncbi:hypothetical protein [Vagococcus hydrophili]|uniref:DNA-binding protein n=1 Tax=Vagococcus hydrophili TaxID=2714947 RepID=A0A6G8AR74_9ENTE|nr:hypothetical protein [Vagococcus hydrophili]QIL47469.1 hypothetical protein G7082_02430 [Vagococcus hydrophili]
MWQLADELHLSISDISQISGIGTLDLKASKEKKSSVFIPRRKAVLTTIRKLEAKKELGDKN